MKKLTYFIALLALLSFKANAQDLYDIDNVTVIELTFWEPYWDDTLDAYYANDVGQRLLASCTVNGVAYDSVGVKYKGNSTYNATNAKNPLNVKLDYIKGNQDYQGWYTLKLSNGKNDPSFVREVLSYEIARKYMEAPLSNYAKVYVNGNFHGVYSSSESINKKFVEERFYSNKNNTLFKCNPVYGSGSPSLTYLGADSSLYFNSYELASDFGWTDLVSYINDLNNNFGSVESTWDMDRAIWMIAFDNVLVSLDSYIGPLKQNYYLCKDDNGRFNSIVWDMNESLGGFEMIGGGGPPGPSSITSLQQLSPLLRMGDNTYPLVNNMLSNARYQKMYMAHFRTITEENFTNGWYHARADSLQDIISADVSADPNAFYTTTQFTNNVTSQITGQGGAYGITQLMDGRLTYLQSNAEYIKVGPAISNITNGTVVPNSTVDFTADISNANYAYLGYRNSKADIFVKTEMFDDGAHNDGAAGDGTYGVSVPVGVSDIQYYIYAENNNAGKFSPVRAEYEFYTLAVAGDVVINELSASNATIMADQNGEFDDWIEFYNNTGNPIVLDGYYLSDDALDLTKWTFPAGTTINANDFLIVWADNDTLQTGLHANFKLSASGESLYFSNPSISLVDETTFGAQLTDITWGRYPNGTGAFTIMNPTFNAVNSNTPVSVAEVNLEQHEELVIYPNPANGIVTFSNSSAEDFAIYNLLGDMIYQTRVLSATQSLDISNWPAGIYIVKTPTQSKKFIVSK
ncbi:MAG: CotH kinase family protein [Flavobacteriales bacterium]|nr:CotH kinase family protein [Flavobacteriales bacterium]